jgi:hypothetical protein
LSTGCTNRPPSTPPRSEGSHPPCQAAHACASWSPLLACFARLSARARCSTALVDDPGPWCARHAKKTARRRVSSTGTRGQLASGTRAPWRPARYESSIHRRLGERARAAFARVPSWSLPIWAWGGEASRACHLLEYGYGGVGYSYATRVRFISC